MPLATRHRAHSSIAGFRRSNFLAGPSVGSGPPREVSGTLAAAPFRLEQRMNGSASRPSSATIKGTRCAIRPDTKATSRDSRSSFETRTLHFALRAAAKAAASCGRRSRASAPLPISASTYSLMIGSVQRPRSARSPPVGLLCRGQSAAVVAWKLEDMRRRDPLTTRYTTDCGVVVAEFRAMSLLLSRCTAT